ncbi:hypothetical protein MHYP_G00256840 [Metynnis hypsauchen]
MQYIWKVFTSAMEFTDEEKKWLVSISAEIPEHGKLTLVEERLCELAKPKTETEGQLFQILASIRFGLTDPVISDLDKVIHSGHERSTISYQCG